MEHTTSSFVLARRATLPRRRRADASTSSSAAHDRSSSEHHRRPGRSRGRSLSFMFCWPKDRAASPPSDSSPEPAPHECQAIEHHRNSSSLQRLRGQSSTQHSPTDSGTASTRAQAPASMQPNPPPPPPTTEQILHTISYGPDYAQTTPSSTLETSTNTPPPPLPHQPDSRKKPIYTFHLPNQPPTSLALPIHADYTTFQGALATMLHRPPDNALARLTASHPAVTLVLRGPDGSARRHAAFDLNLWLAERVWERAAAWVGAVPGVAGVDVLFGREADAHAGAERRAAVVLCLMRWGVLNRRVA